MRWPHGHAQITLIAARKRGAYPMSAIIVVGYVLIGLLAAYLGLRIAHDILGYRDFELVVLYFLSVALWPLAFPAIAILGWSKGKEEAVSNGKR